MSCRDARAQCYRRRARRRTRRHAPPRRSDRTSLVLLPWTHDSPAQDHQLRGAAQRDRGRVERDGRGLEVEFFDGALHDYPDRLRAAVQERIDATPGERDIFLCCARCSNGTVGLKGGDHRLVLPAADDCISLLLGSRAALPRGARRPARDVLLHARVDRLHRRPVQGVPGDRPQVRRGEGGPRRAAHHGALHARRGDRDAGRQGARRQARVPRDREPLLRPAAGAPHRLAALPREAGERAARRGVPRRRARRRARRIALLGALQA